jgi:hypothetical protein
MENKNQVTEQVEKPVINSISDAEIRKNRKIQVLTI